MARKPRLILPDHLYEVTLPTFQGRYFFVPSVLLNALIVGVLAYAQAKYGVRVCFAVFLSNHGHLLIRADSAQQVADFLCLAKSQIAKEVQRLCGWSGGIFMPHSTITLVTEEPEAQPKDYRRRLMDRSQFRRRPGSVPHSEAPKVHAATVEEWRRWVEVYDGWYDRYRRASARLRQGIVEALEEFPPHAFVPTGLYRRYGEGLPPPGTPRPAGA